MEPTTLRDEIESALETAAPAPAPAQDSAPADYAPAPAAPEVAASSGTEAAPAADLNALSEGSGGDETQSLDQPRDEQGKFKTKQEGIQPGPKSGPKPNAGERAPVSWRPEIREHWGALPEPVRQEVARREAEVQRTLQETAEARKTVEAITNVVQPYMPFIKAEGSNPIQAIDNLMATAAKLRTGTAPELAQMVAGIVNQFGVGRFGNSFIEALDSALAGQAPRVDPQTQAVEQVLNQKLAPVQQMLNQFQQAQAMQQQAVMQRTQSEVEQFLSKAEFGNDVRQEMADIMESAMRRGQEMSLVDAYKKACLVNDNVRKALQARAKARGAQQQTQAAQKARAAAVSVSGSAPMGALQQPSTDVRSAIEAAIMQSER